MTEDKKKQDAQEWAARCHESEIDGCCPAMGFINCPFPDKLCTDVTPEDWLKWMKKDE